MYWRLEEKNVSFKGSNFIVRKLSKEPISVVQLIRLGIMGAEEEAYLWMALREQINMWVCGEMASGKTMTLDAIAAFIQPEYKIISIEDTEEVNLPHENWVRELTRDPGSPESSITMFDLLGAALRQKPGYIVVGEIRGREGNIAFQVMQSVPWHTPIMVRRNGVVEIAAIGSIVDRYFGEGEGDGEKLVSDLEVLTITRSMHVSFARVSRVIRHWYRGKLYRIWLSDGSYVDVTGSHSLIAYNPVRGLYEVKPTELYRGDWLLTASLPIMSYEEPRESLEALGYLCGAALVSGELVEDGDRSRLKLHISGGKDVSVLLRFLTLLKDHVEIYPVKNGIEIRAPKGSMVANAMRCVYGDFPYEISYVRPFAYNVIRALGELCGSKCDGKSVKGVKLSDIISWLKRIHRLEDLEDPILGNSNNNVEDSVEIGRGIRVVSVTHIDEIDYKGYVYDLSVPGDETFLGGSKPVLLHNTGHSIMSTFHAANIQKLIQKLTGSSITSGQRKHSPDELF